MNLRFITRDIHAFIDYPVALGLLAAPLVLGLGESHVAAHWLSIVTGAAALLLTILTDHRTGLIRVLPYWFHVAVDAAVGVVFVLAPFVLGFAGIDAWFYLLNGAAVMTVVSLSDPASLRDVVAVPA